LLDDGRFNTMQVCDGQRDGPTDTLLQQIPLNALHKHRVAKVTVKSNYMSEIVSIAIISHYQQSSLETYVLDVVAVYFVVDVVRIVVTEYNTIQYNTI